MTPVAAGSKSEVAYDWIRARIANHEYGPGYRLVLGTIAAELDQKSCVFTPHLLIVPKGVPVTFVAGHAVSTA